MNRLGRAWLQPVMPTPELMPLSVAPVRTPANRVIQGMLLSGGAVLLALTAGADRIPFYWTPLILGLRTSRPSSMVHAGAIGRRHSE